MLKKIVKIAATLCSLIFGLVTVSHSQVCQPAPAGMVSWWSADGNTLDARSRHNGTLIGNTGFAAGEVAQAYNLDGNNDSVQIAPSASHDINGSFSAEAWIFPRTLPNTGPRIFDKDANTGSRWLMSLNNVSGNTNSLSVGINTFVVTTSENSVLLNQWNHVAFSYNSLSGDLVIYINGIQSATGTQIGLISNNPAPLVIGDDFGTSTREFDGLIDEPAIYNRALSASDIAAIHAAGTAGKCKPTATVAPSGQIGWWAGDGNASDIAGTNSGSLQNGAAFAVSKVGQGFSFDGADDSIEIPDSASVSITGEITIEAWIRPEDVGGTKTILSKYDSLSPQLSYFLGLQGDEVEFIVYGNANGSLRRILNTTNANVPTDSMTYVAAIFNPGGQVMKVYVNGVEAVASVDPSSTTVSAIFDSTTPVRIGGVSSTTDTLPFGGVIDEVSIYNRALNDAEITSVFNAGIAGKLKETPTTGVTATVGDVTVTYSDLATRRTQQIPLEAADMPALPIGMTATGLLYDIATDVIPSGTTDLCFNLRAFAALSNAEFLQRRILHLEGGSWINRTISWNFANKTICAQVLSLSPFAIVDSNIAPTAAIVSVGGRVLRADGQGISKAVVSIADLEGNVRRALTNPFGYYKFDQVQAGASYIVSVQAKQYQFENPVRTVNVVDELADVDFTALPLKRSSIEALRAYR